VVLLMDGEPCVFVVAADAGALAMAMEEKGRKKTNVCCLVPGAVRPHRSAEEHCFVVVCVSLARERAALSACLFV